MKQKTQKSKIEFQCEVQMNYHNITTDDMLNGDGLRTVLWVSGCEHHCANCQNPETWSEDGGLRFDMVTEQELFEKLSKPYIAGITLSGGDPLHKSNRATIERILERVKSEFKQKTVWLYTGYKYEGVKDIKLLEHVDVLVDGEYIEQLSNKQLHWRGSSNQRVIDVAKSREENKVVLLPTGDSL